MYGGAVRSESGRLAVPCPHCCAVRGFKGSHPAPPPNPTTFYVGQSELVPDLKRPHGPPLALQSKTAEAQRGEAEPEKHPGSQPAVQFCTCVLCVLSASPSRSSKSPRPLRPDPRPSVSEIPFLANLGNEAGRNTLFTFLTASSGFLHRSFI